MNIVFVIPSMLRGGAERVISILCNELSARDNNVYLCLTENATDILYPLTDKVQVIDLTRTGSSFAVKIPQYINGIYRIIKEKKADVLVSFITRTNIFSIIACKFAGISVIVSERNNPKLIPANKNLRRLRDFIYRYADGIVFQTQFARDYYCDKITTKSAIIKNPCQFTGKVKLYKEKSDTIISACRLVPQKNVSLLIEAFDLIKDRIPTYSVHIYGDGPLRDELDVLIKQKNLQNRVDLKGVESDIITKMSEAKVFALSSDFEGLSNSLAEALCTGAACIATDSPTYGNRSVMIDGVSGVLVPVGDVKRFAEKLLKITTDQEFANGLSNEAVKIREEIGTDRIISEWLTYIKDTIITKSKYSKKEISIPPPPPPPLSFYDKIKNSSKIKNP